MIVAGSASPLLLSSAGGYNLTKSLRFRSSASAYLNRTPASAGNRKTWTWSAWVKRGAIADGVLFSVGTSGSSYFNLRFQDNSGVQEFSAVSENPSTDITLRTSQQFRDPSAWYHLVFVLDTTQATSSNRAKFYVNGSQVTAFSSATYPTQNADLLINNNQAHNIARRASASDLYFDGYMTEINFIDGQALTPSSFGQTSPTTGVWQPKRYTGTYGTNGFYLPFTNTTSTSTLGNDFSGNSNTWTVNNISLTSGATYDSMTDVPTLTSATTANYCVINPLWKGSSVTVAAGNLDASATSLASNQAAISTMFVSSGKWYFEYIQNTDTNSNLCVGIADQSFNATNNYVGGTATTYGYVAKSNLKFNNSSFSSYGTGSSANGDVLMCAFDLDNGKIYFGKNGTWYGSGDPVAGTNAAFTSISGTYCPAYSHNSGSSQSTSASFNFGQRPFAYTPPTGFVALNTFNLPTPTIGATASSQANKYFNVVTWTGNGTSSGRSITGVGFQPDFVWGKPRSLAYTHSLSDAVRGANKRLSSNSTSAEDTNFQYGYTSSFDTDGFTTSAGSSSNENWNTTNETFVAWNWKANGSGSTNTAGSITSTVSANTTAGFSIVTYTGNGTIGATIGHGLGVAPSMLIVKQRTGGLESWQVYHSVLGATQYLQLNSTGAAASNINRWNNTAPTSTVFTVYNDTINNGNTNTYVAYCFAQVAGYSAFGSYTGNGSSDGPFIFTGFRPRFVMIKRTDVANDWVMYDTSRSTYNVDTILLTANTANNEAFYASGYDLDILSNGFKARAATSAAINTNAGTYIYMAFAESPFKYANAR